MHHKMPLINSFIHSHFLSFPQMSKAVPFQVVTSGLLIKEIIFVFSGSTVNVVVTLEREDEVAGPVIAPLFPQVCLTVIQLDNVLAANIFSLCHDGFESFPP